MNPSQGKAETGAEGTAVAIFERKQEIPGAAAVKGPGQKWRPFVETTGIGVATDSAEGEGLDGQGIKAGGTDDGGGPAAKGAADGPDEVKRQFGKGRR